MRRSLESVLAEARTLPADDLPQLCADLELVRVTALARLSAPAATPPDELLDVHEVAARLHMSADYVYRHARSFPFTVKNGTGRALRFSSSGLESYLRKSR
jgi:predicted DNA-binding transcriptional regulator AlpA